jgi:hypothetical protein
VSRSLEFIDLSEKGYSHKFFGLENTETKERLGVIKWSEMKMQYLYTTNRSVVFTTSMLKELAEFIRELNSKSNG